MIRSAIGILAIAMTASAARPIAAEDLALVLVNSDYATLDDLSGDRYAARFESELEGAGFTTFALQDGTAAETSAMVRDFAAAVGAGRDNRIVIILSGHLVHTGAETWLLAEDARNPDGFTVATMGQALSPLFALAGDAQGRAVVLLAPSGDAGETGIALSSGGGDIAVPQGVTRVTGEVRALFTALRDGLLPALRAELAPYVPAVRRAAAVVAAAAAADWALRAGTRTLLHEGVAALRVRMSNAQGLGVDIGDGDSRRLVLTGDGDADSA